MSFAPTLRALLSHWMRNRVQFVGLLVGLTLATALWTAVQAINAQARLSYGNAAAALAQSSLPRLVAAEGRWIDEAMFAHLRRNGWAVSPVVEGSFTTKGGLRLAITGVDLVSAPSGGGAQNAQDGANLLAFIEPPGQALAAPATVAALRDVAGLPHLIVDPALPENRLVMDIGVAQSLIGAQGHISHLVVMPQASGSPAPLAEIAPQLRLVAPQDDVGLAQLTDSFHLNLTAFGLLSFAVGLFIVHAAVGLAFEQRRVMFRTLRALGVSLDVLTAALASELAVFAVAGGAFGVALGYALAGFLLPDVAATLRGLYGADVAGGLQLPALWWAGGLGIALAGTAVAGAQSLYRLRRMPLLAPARPRAWARPGKAALLRQFALCCGLALGALALAIWGRGLISGFSLIGAMMMSAALAMPLVMGGLLRWASGRARRALAQWFWSDTAHQLPGLSLALMALLLAVSANIGVATMVGSFRSAFQGFLDQRLAPELYISVPEATRRAEVEEFLIQRAEAVLPIWRADVGLEGQPGRLYGFRDHPTYRESWPLIASGPDAWARVVRGDAVLINEQLARRMDLWPGDSLRLPAGPPVPIAGVYSDYGSPRPQAMMSLQLIGARAAQIDKSSFAVRIDPNRADTLARDLVSRFGLTDDEVIDQAGLKAFSLGVFDRTFTITAALNGLTLGVAGIAVLTGLLTLARMRLPQLAPVWALGLTRAQLGRLELGRALLLAVLVFVLALPVGLCLAWILLAVVNVEAFGWRIPMRLFPWDWAGLAATTVLAAAAAAAWPAWRLAHTPPADLLKVFGHER